MNCHRCGNRNPSTADHCLHCGAPFANANKGGGFFDVESDDPDSFWGGNKIFYIFGGTITTIIVVSMVLFGFDKYSGACVHSSAAAARYESAPDWERDRDGERRWRSNQAMRDRKTHGHRGSSFSSDRYVRCYRKFQGHHDGVLE